MSAYNAGLWIRRNNIWTTRKSLYRIGRNAAAMTEIDRQAFSQTQTYTHEIYTRTFKLSRRLLKKRIFAVL